MADEDKQFDATPRKLEQARKEGQVVKSKDFSTAVSLLIIRNSGACSVYLGSNCPAIHSLI